MEITPQFLLQAYAAGYFPMADSQNGEISWYKPDPRAVLPLEKFHVSHSLAKTLRKQIYRVTFDTRFAEVVEHCAHRRDDSETWISAEIKTLYQALFTAGFCHSVEVWSGETLVGGLYGVALAGAFFAESKFSHQTDASKVALHALVERLKEKKFALLEVQFLTPHLESLGAVEITSAAYEAELVAALGVKTTF